jgi:hypothetical protein
LIWRRSEVMERFMQGMTQSEISKDLKLSPELVSLDLKHIREEARERLNNVIERELPLQWMKTRTAIQFMQKEALKIFKESTASSSNVKLAALQAFGNAQ